MFTFFENFNFWSFLVSKKINHFLFEPFDRNLNLKELKMQLKMRKNLKHFKTTVLRINLGEHFFFF